MSKIYDAQDRLVTLLTANSFFKAADSTDPGLAQAVPVLSQRKGNLANEVQQRLSRIGACVLVLLPSLTFEGQSARVSLNLHFGLIVSENPTINQGAVGTGQPAEAIMEKVFQLVHWQMNAAGNARDVQATKFKIDPDAARLIEPNRANPALLNYVIKINTIVNFP